jgi:pimeloyl-ACP methyl ester carboxylesterase
MYRRQVLKSVGTLAAGVGVRAIGIQAATTQASAAELVPLRRIVTAEGTNLFYKAWGAGRPVVFVSSWGLNADMWAYQTVALSGPEVRCIAFDRRGHGRSSDPGRGYDYDTLADDLATVIEQLELNEITLIGHSMGAGEIVRYLSRHGPSRVARVVLLAPSTPFLLKTADNPDGVDKAVFEQMRAMWRQDFPKWLFDNARPFFVPATSQEMIQWVGGMMLQTSLKTLIDLNVLVTETDFRGELGHVTVPTLIIHGDRDHSAPLGLTGEKTARLIPGSRLTVYEGAPHGLMFTHLERLNADLLAFVTS